MDGYDSTKLASGENQTEDSGPNGRNLRPTVDPVGSIRLILSTSLLDFAMVTMNEVHAEKVEIVYPFSDQYITGREQHDNEP